MPKIANIQLNSQDNIDQNLDIIKTAVQTAVHEGAGLIVLPENACMMGSQTELASRFDEMVGFYGELAKTLHVHILAGTLPCPIHLDGTPTEAKFYLMPAAKNLARFCNKSLFGFVALGAR
ncbi:MAG: nitrilase-related carbon-nitrogen hydrolase [Moraxella sp.]|uniref:nitrilase-related carbon-nitrogen hydrolase n=1 Tax=Moraxella sp. TaxID=479 RepID=UPI0026DC65A0|nr:nitrilase-related carbon-nitrogen hydrolase [Moraxella sp.]MDO4450291.1 nitrilase-related carbon-nitrogen hydrolase [Moraxella sp.]